MMRNIFNGLVLTVLFLLAGCSPDTDNPSTLQQAEYYCLEQNGTIIEIDLDDNESTTVCRYEEESQFDDGTSTFTHNCEIIAFYEGRCDELAVNDFENGELVQSTLEDETLGTSLHNRVVDIMNNLDNTGYAHNRNDNFSLDPDVDTFPFPDGVTSHYNLFLDCSGFVGYYVLQGIVKALYDDLESNSAYSCSRPLAADFADAFMDADNSFEEATEEDIDNGNVCWGQVKSLENAKPGDIIVYTHPDNFGSDTETCSDGRTIQLAECTKYDGDSCASRKNTGHVLIVHKTPYKSQHCKDDTFLSFKGCYDNETVADIMPGDFQWVVHVADSTTSAHSSDSRNLGEDKSVYNNNYYHAWSKTYNGVSDLARCNDGSYHRDCTNHGGIAESIVINTTHETNPTGIGVGYIYVNDARDGFRSKYGSDIESADIYIGRPVKCDSLGL